MFAVYRLITVREQSTVSVPVSFTSSLAFRQTSCCIFRSASVEAVETQRMLFLLPASLSQIPCKHLCNLYAVFFGKLLYDLLHYYCYWHYYRDYTVHPRAPNRNKGVLSFFFSRRCIDKNGDAKYCNCFI